MGLNPIKPGLRTFVNDIGDGVTKISLSVPAGAEIAVDDTVAAQLPAAFKDPETVAARDAERAEFLPKDDDGAADEHDAKPKRSRKNADAADGDEDATDA